MSDDQSIRDTDSVSTRRRFLQVAGAAGLAGALGIAGWTGRVLYLTDQNERTSIERADPDRSQVSGPSAADIPTDQLGRTPRVQRRAVGRRPSGVCHPRRRYAVVWRRRERRPRRRCPTFPRASPVRRECDEALHGDAHAGSVPARRPVAIGYDRRMGRPRIRERGHRGDAVEPHEAHCGHCPG